MAAIRLLDKVSIDRQMYLFSQDGVDASKRLAWLYKINLLRSIGRHREALAWTCLECEYNPQNVTAQAMKEELKQTLFWAQSQDQSRSDPTNGERRLTDIWQGVAGIRELKTVLERDVILPLRQPELYRRYRLSLPNGVLLYGPPGCGKTFIAQKLGDVIGFHFIQVRPSDLSSIYVHGTQGKIGELFAQARKNAPCLLFFDELDAMLPNRGDRLGHHYSSEVNEFLTQLNRAIDQQVLVVGATNRLDQIDPAAIRPGRFDKKVYVGLPDMEARVELLKLYMADRPQEDIDFTEVGKECEGYTCAEIEHVVNEAARKALEKRRDICVSDLVASLAANPPTHADAKPEMDSG